MGIIFGCPMGITLGYTLVIILWRQFFTWRICQTYPPPEPWQSYILKQTWCLFLRLSIEVLKPKSLLKLSPWTRGPKNYSGPQSHTFTSLLIESRVSRAQKLFRTSITHFYFFTYWVPSLEGPKIIQDLNHTFLLLYLPSPESWIPTNPGPKSQHPGFKLLTGVPTIKEPNGKKKLGASRARCHGLLYIQCGCVMQFGAKRCAQRARRGCTGHDGRAKPAWAARTGPAGAPHSVRRSRVPTSVYEVTNVGIIS